jgi:hypothetical protein
MRPADAKILKYMHRRKSLSDEQRKKLYEEIAKKGKR